MTRKYLLARLYFLLLQYLGTMFTISYLEDVSSSNIPMDIYTAQFQGKKVLKLQPLNSPLKLLLQLYPWMKLGLGSGSWCKRNQGLSNDSSLLHYTQVHVLCQKEVEETASCPDHLLSDYSKFTLPPISDLYNSTLPSGLTCLLLTLTLTFYINSNRNWFVCVYLSVSVTTVAASPLS